MNIDALSQYFEDPLIELFTGDSTQGLHENQEIQIVADKDHQEIILKQGKHMVACSVDEDHTLLKINLGDNIWVTQRIHSGRVSLQQLKLQPIQDNPSSALIIAVDEKIRDEVTQKAGFKNISIEEAAAWLQTHFLLSGKQKPRALMARYRGASNSEGITLIGEHFRLSLEATGDSELWARQLAPTSLNKNFSLSLIETDIQFVDATVAAKLASPEALDALKSVRRDNSSYIALWEKYSRIEDERAQAEAIKIGYVRYVKFEPVEKTERIEWQFSYKQAHAEDVDNFYKAVKDHGGQLELSNQLPPWLTNQEEAISLADSTSEDSIKVRLLKKTAQYLVLDIEQGKPAQEGVIYLSLTGTMVNMKRRQKAKDLINTQQNGMPQLCYLIENLPVPVRRTKTLKALTASSKALFKGKPTKKQIHALEVALNTPDIALILGPPGTGKTQIISALQSRLAEESTSDIGKTVLVSSFQHDAVDNVVARSDVYGLPAIRIGAKDRGQSIFQQWISKQQTQIKTNLNQNQQHTTSYKLVSSVQEDIAALLAERLLPSEYNHRMRHLYESLQALETDHAIVLPLSLTHPIEEAIQALSTKKETTTNINNKKLLAQIRALRVTPTAFNDDGSERAYDMLSAIRKLSLPCSKGEIALLDTLAETFDTPAKDSLTRLALLRQRLLKLALPDQRPKSLSQALDSKSQQLLKNLSQALAESLSTCLAGVPDILEDFLDTLSYQKFQVSETVEKYTTTLGATCQGSVSNGMASALSVRDTDGSGINFDTVIIDEAARANPLDLFIPMSLAKRRIILVGDHFQLPQMLEPDIENEMNASDDFTEACSKALKESLFERLYKELRQREIEDGITRTAMLDTQFRMHPAIGKFISRHFYESQNEEPLQPGLPASQFSFELKSFDHTPMHWVNVPLKKAPEKRRHGSYHRQEEAREVTQIAAEILKENAMLSIGIITFYAAQREAIFGELQNKSICQKTDDDKWEYATAYQSTADGEERIKVGTVDAFQGKEFDVVILSMTRSNNINGLEEEKLNHKYGFLRLPNRLNVAFSRAKKAIIVVGDHTMFSSKEAAIALPSVYDYATNLGEVTHR